MTLILELIAWTDILWIIMLVGYKIFLKRIRFLPKLPLGLFIVYFCIRLIGPFTEQITWMTEFSKWVDVSGDVVLAWAIAHVAFEIVVEISTRYKYQRELPKITRDFLLVIIFSILFLVVLRARSNVNLIGLVTTSAALTIILGLAAQTSLRNFFAGLILQFERPYKIGDWVKHADAEGRVVGITWRSTHLRTRENYHIYIPNEVIFANIFKNYSQPENRMIGRMVVGVDYTVSPNKVERIIREVIDQHPNVIKKPPTEIRLIKFGDFTIDYEIRFWHKSKRREPQLKAEIRNRIWYSFRRNQIRIPFPIRDVRFAHVERRENQRIHLAYNEEVAQMLKKVPVLSLLSSEERSNIIQSLDCHDFGAGEQIVKKNEPGDALYIIWSGKCEVLCQQSNCIEKPIAVIQKGDCFGEMSLLTGQRHNATVRALIDCVIVVVNKETFSTVLTVNPKIMELLGEMMAKRQIEIKETTNQIPDETETASNIISRIKTFFGI